MPVLRKYSSIAAILLCLYAVCGFFILPFLVRHFGEKALQEHLSPDSTISKVRMNPFLFSVQVEGLATADPAGAWTAQWDVLVVDVSALTLIKWYPVLDRIALEGSAFSVERVFKDADSAQAIDELESAKGWREVMASVGRAEIPKLRIDLLEVSAGQVTFVDHTNALEYRQVIEPINFSLNELTTVSEGATQMQFSAKTPLGALIQWEGTVGAHPLRSQGSFSLEALGLENFSPYYQQFTQFDLKRAVFGVSFEYVFDLSDLDHLVAIQNAHLALTELLCERTDGSGRLIAIDEIVVEGGTFKFPQMELDIERIGVSNGQTLIQRRADGSINLLGLVAVPGAVRTAEVQEKTSNVADESGFTYRVDLIEITNYEVSWEEDLAGEFARLAVNVPTVRIKDVSSDLASPFTFYADYRIGESGQILMEGSVVTAAKQLNTSLLVNDLDLSMGAAYAKQFGGVDLESGVLNFDAQVSYDGAAGLSLDGSGGVTAFAAGYGADMSAQWEALTLEVSARFEEAAGLSLTGSVDLNGFAAKRGTGLEANWNALALKGLSLTTEPLAIHLDSVLLDTPVLSVLSAARSESAEKMEAADLGSAEDQSDSNPLAVSVDAISVQQGALSFVDESVAPSATISMTKLTASVNHVDLASSTPISIEVTALVNQSPFNLTGQLQPNDLKAGTALQFQLGGLMLPAFSPYTGKAVGRTISKGALSIDSDWTVTDSQLKASNKIVVKQLKFGDKVQSETALKLPLDLAVTLLAGPNGQMDLSLPLSGDLSDPKASLGQIIRVAVVGLVTNVAAAPFKLLSGLVASEDDLSVVEFDAGAAELSNQMLDRLSTIADALKQRPGLNLEIIPMISVADQVALSTELLRIQILEDPKLEDDKKFRKGVTQLYRDKMEAAGTPDRDTDADTLDALERMLSVILPDIELPESETERLAAARSTAVFRYFIESHGIDPARLNVALAEPSDGSAGLRFDLK